MTNHEIGDTFVTDDGEQHYQIQTIERSYTVQVKPADGSDDTADAETITYPGSTLERKLERGELEPVEPEPEDDDAGVECPAAGCDDTFDSEQGAKSHFSQVHDDDETDSEGS